VYLKHITLHGFKSFADRTEFEFGPGRTGIVGPNGCGKSNVLDAVRWVLGEQSAKTLRGTKMLDVIFAGSRTRKPANFAEVELTFDNHSHTLACDETEVSISRTLYASGESEYRINGNIVRLKDIRELFLDTGVGLDAYSVIEQGKVDALLQASPQQRRDIFEEAAGISRYRVRRVEAARKLERTQNNLLRLHDVIEELERRLRSVKLAAGKARNFQEYDQRLRELRCTFSLAEYHALQAGWRATKAKAAAMSDLLGAKRADLARYDAAASELAHQVQAHDERVQAVTAQLLELQSEVGKLAERIAQEQRRAAEFAEARDRHIAEAAAAERRAADLAARLTCEEDALLALRAAEDTQAGVVAELRAHRGEGEGRREEARRRWQAERSVATEIEREVARLGSERSIIAHEQQRLEQRRTELSQRAAALAARSIEAEQRRAALEQAMAEREERRTQLIAELDALDRRLGAAQGTLAEVDRRLAAAKEQRSAVASRLGLLEELEQRHEGVDDAVRSILAWSAEARYEAGVVGLVADLLRIDDPRAGALQAVLSEVENRLVVRRRDDFVAAVRRQPEPPGPVQVLSLDRVPVSDGERPFAGLPGVVACAADWVRCDDAHRDLAELLFGRVVIVATLDDALSHAAPAAPGLVFVSLDGYAVAADGRLIVGAAKGSAGRIRRHAQIRRLVAERDEIETSLERLTRERLSVQQELDDAQVQRVGLLNQTAALQKQAIESGSALSRLQESLAADEQEQESLRGEDRQCERQARELAERLAGVGLGQAQAERRAEAQREVIAGCEQALAEIDLAVQRVSEELTQALVEAGRTSERRTAAEQALQGLRGQVSQQRASREQSERQAADAEQRVAIAQVEGQACESRQAALAERARSIEQQSTLLRQGRTELRARLERCNGVVRGLHNELDETEQVLRNHEVALREVEVRRENLVTRVAEELSLNLVELHETYRHAERDWEAIRAEIETLREKIARLGNVNLDAISELEELAPRYESLVAQRADLQDSLTRLENLIKELDEESRTRFDAVFQQIREHFQELFRKVFGGGKADIILEDPSNSLECGIDIIARPPGKEPQSISLLSGGEKTMTAIALLLAVFKSRPSPFAFLDEVDAALDEANLDRFNMVVDEFLHESQFIIITHNKRTMQRSDVLYGVTMEEPGVSRRVSVRLEDRAQAPDRVQTPVGA